MLQSNLKLDELAYQRRLVYGRTSRLRLVDALGLSEVPLGILKPLPQLRLLMVFRTPSITNFGGLIGGKS